MARKSKQQSKVSYLALLAVMVVVGFIGLKKGENENLLPEKDEWLPNKDAQIVDNRADTENNNDLAESGGRFEIPVYESPRGGHIIRHTGFTLSYDADFKTPQWVGWEVTADETRGNQPRENSFKPDPMVRGAKAYHKDYSNSDYDRGHMAPAADMKWSEVAMKESFYTSNICPQNRNLNRGDWNDLEELTRQWAVRYGAVSVTAGPIYRTRTPKRIGANRVAVPDAFFKVILINTPKNPKAYGFIFENRAGSHPLSYYQLTVDEVETETGMDFFAALPDKVENRIESVKPSL